MVDAMWRLLAAARGNANYAVLARWYAVLSGLLGLHLSARRILSGEVTLAHAMGLSFFSDRVEAFVACPAAVWLFHSGADRPSASAALFCRSGGLGGRSMNNLLLAGAGQRSTEGDGIGVTTSTSRSRQN